MQLPSPPVQKYDRGVAKTTVLVNLVMHSAELVMKCQVSFKEDPPTDPDFMYFSALVMLVG